MKKALPWMVVGLALAWVVASFRAPASPGFDLVGFGRLPVLVNGRVKPMDTVARTSLLLLQGRQRVRLPDKSTVEPEAWLLDVLFRSSLATQYAVFEINHPEVLSLLGLTPEQGDGHKRFSLQQFAGKLAEVDRQARLADGTDRAQRTSFQRAIVQLRDAIALHQRLQGSVVAFESDTLLDQLKSVEVALTARPEPATLEPGTVQPLKATLATMDSFAHLRPIPPSRADDTHWRTMGAAWTTVLNSGQPDADASAWVALGRAWRDRDETTFNRAAAALQASMDTRYPEVTRKNAIEVFFNRGQPFYLSSILYVGAFLAAILSWLRWGDVLRPTAWGLVLVAFALTSFGIATRMWLEGRPPVTNLYSSALFVGWGAAGLCVLLERLYRNGIGSAAAGVVGFIALVIAHHLALGGDTMEMMRAVLDSNFWLATHVVTITVGYSATFLAGFLALIYVLRGVLTRSLDGATADALTRMIYGVICFATLFSLVGTILGGIWADQSWGRFWGWDPKENGALLIVIWNSVILHARWAGLVRGRGLASLAIFGNIVTAWSWFGVNMLGVGLHSYGFMDAAFWWLIAFVGSQLGVILLAAVPTDSWRSFKVAR